MSATPRLYSSPGAAAASATRQVPNISWVECFARHDQVVNEITQRRNRIVQTFQTHGVAYALIGGQAVAAWVASVDPDAVRTTKDVDILLNQADLPQASAAAAAAGFSYEEVMNVPMFVELAAPSPKRAVHIVWADQLVRAHEQVPAPRVDESTVLGGMAVASLDALLRMKLTAWRRHDQVHVDDLLKVGLIDATWVARFPPELAARLQFLIANPE